MKLFTILTYLAFLLSMEVDAQHADTFTSSYKNRIITICSVHIDTEYHQVLDAGEEKYTVTIKKHEQPILLSGERIYNSNDVSMPVQLGDGKPGSVKSHVKNILSAEINKMDEFAELQIVIDEEGELAYIHLNSWISQPGIEETIAKKIEDMHFIPAQRNGNMVPYYFEITK